MRRPAGAWQEFDVTLVQKRKVLQVKATHAGCTWPHSWHWLCRTEARRLDYVQPLSGSRDLPRSQSSWELKLNTLLSLWASWLCIIPNALLLPGLRLLQRGDLRLRDRSS